MLQPRRLQRKPRQRGMAIIRGRLAGTGHAPELLRLTVGLAVEGESGLNVSLTVGEEDLKAGLLPVNAIYQSLAGNVIKKTLREAYRPQGPLLSRQLFPLHQAVKGDKPARDLRIVNAVIELRHDTEQMAKHAGVMFHGLRGRQGLLTHPVTQRGKCVQRMQCITDTFADGAPREEGLLAKYRIQRSKIFVYQRPAGFAFRRVELTL